MSKSLLVLAAIALAAVPASAQNNGSSANSGILTTTTIWAGIYTNEQATQGHKFYIAACSDCHGDQLEGDPGQGFPGLADPSFMVEWDGQSMADFVHHIHTAPDDKPGDMDRATAVVLAAFILSRNGVPSGKTPLSTNSKAQATILITQQKPK
jgi:mono/diheme cytochrome c family protein